MIGKSQQTPMLIRDHCHWRKTNAYSNRKYRHVHNPKYPIQTLMSFIVGNQGHSLDLHSYAIWKVVP
jgi:hypothetical protein